MLLDLLGDDQYFLYVYGWSHTVLTGITYLLLCSGTTIVTTVFFWIAASGYMFVDLTGRPAFIFKWVTMPLATVSRWSSFTTMCMQIQDSAGEKCPPGDEEADESRQTCAGQPGTATYILELKMKVREVPK